MNSNNIQKLYSEKFSNESYDNKHETQMVSYRFLSEIERISDEKNLNRKELAKAIGTSASFITQLFRGVKIINIETIAKFQKALDVIFEIKAIPISKENAYSEPLKIYEPLAMQTLAKASIEDYKNDSSSMSGVLHFESKSISLQNNKLQFTENVG